MRAFVLLVALALVGCGTAPAPSPTPSFAELPEPAKAARTPAAACADETIVGTGIWTSADGAWFETGVIGEGETVAVMVPQQGVNYCGFVAYALVLAEHGIQSRLINLCGSGATTCGLEDNIIESGASAVLAAAEQARADGASRVVGLGASMGGTTVIRASEICGDDGRLDAVASLSGPIEFAGVNTQSRASEIAIPMFLAVSGGDGVVTPVQFDRLGEASSSPEWKQHVGIGHGWALLFDEAGTVTENGMELIGFIAG